MSQGPEIRRERVYVEEGPEIRRRKEVIRNVGAERRLAVSKIASLVWLAFGVLDMLLVFRFVLKLIGANPNNGFANFIYDLTALFIQPFVGLVESPTSDRMVLELSTLVAIVVYSLVAWVLVRLLWIIFYRPNTHVVSTFEERDT